MIQLDTLPPDTEGMTAEGWGIDLDDEYFETLKPLSSQQLDLHFDELTAMAAEQPEESVAQQGLLRVLREVQSRGDIERAMEMAMTLGAMACLHPELEATANQAGQMVDANSSNLHTIPGQDAEIAKADKNEKNSKSKKKKNKDSGWLQLFASKPKKVKASGFLGLLGVKT